MDNKKFAETIVRLRKEKGLTQSEVAERLSVSPQAVSKWENGDSLPDISLLLPLAELYGVTLDYLMGREPEPVVTYEEAAEPVDLSGIFIKIRIMSKDKDRVNVNLPLQLIEAMKDKEGHVFVGPSDVSKNIDFNKIIELVKKGALGNLVEIESADGDTVQIFAEKIS